MADLRARRLSLSVVYVHTFPQTGKKHAGRAAEQSCKFADSKRARSKPINEIQSLQAHVQVCCKHIAQCWGEVLKIGGAG